MNTNSLTIGAVAYDPKVVGIWEGIRSYLRDDAKLDAEVVLFLNYRAQVEALLAGRIDIGWNTNLAHLQSEAWSEGACVGLAMRDTDRGWRSLLLAPASSAIREVGDLAGKTLAIGSRDSGHAAILPLHFLRERGVDPGRILRFDSDVGKHGDTGKSELEVLAAVLDGRADAGFVGSPFWQTVEEKSLAPRGALRVAWSSPEYTHCAFTSRRGLDEHTKAAFQKALFGMSWEDPRHRPILEQEGLRRWVEYHDGYASLRDAARHAGHLDRRTP